jgi:hypothetical protein
MLTHGFVTIDDKPIAIIHMHGRHNSIECINYLKEVFSSPRWIPKESRLCIMFCERGVIGDELYGRKQRVDAIIDAQPERLGLLMPDQFSRAAGNEIKGLVAVGKIRCEIFRDLQNLYDWILSG